MRKLTLKYTTLGILGFVSGFMLVIVLLGVFHSHPNVEDLELAVAPRELGWVKALVNILITYDGRYSTNLLHCINPLVWGGINTYKYLILFGFIFFMLSLKIGVFNLTTGVFSKKLFAFFVFSGFVLATIPSYAHALYWMGSSFVYLYASVFMILFTSLLIKYVSKQDSNSFLNFVVLCLVGFIAVGFSELYLPFYLALSILILTYAYKTKTVIREELVLIAFLCFFSVWFAASSPGLSYRQEKSNFLAGALDFNVYLVLFKNYIKFIWHYIFTFQFLFFILSSAFLYKFSIITEKFRFSNLQIIGIFLFGAVLTLVMTVPFYLAKNYVIEDLPIRVYTPTAIIYCLMTFFVLAPRIARIMEQFSKNELLFQLLFLIIFIINLFGINAQRMDWQVLFSDAISGKLQSFDGFMLNRYKEIERAKESESEYIIVCTEEMVDYPKSLYTYPDIESNRAKSKWNKYMEAYFKIDEIKVSSEKDEKYKIDK